MVGVPFATAGALVPSVLPIALLVVGGLFVIALLDVAVSYGKLNGIRVAFPAVVRMTKDREGRIEVRVQNDTAREQLLRLGLAFPPEIRAEKEDLVALLPAGAQQSRLEWPCTPAKRGSYRLTTCHLEGASLFGFWSLRTAVPIDLEVRAYPNLSRDRKDLAALFLNRGNFGLHAQRQVGKGRDFEKLRDYIAGDGFEDIHWKATAKRGHPVTKVFQIERTQEVYVIIDASRLSARLVSDLRFETRDPAETGPAVEDELRIASHESPATELERFLTAALVLGLAAEKQGDLFGVLSFADRVKSFVRAKNGKQHYDSCRDALYTLQPQLVNPDFDDVCTFLRLRLRRRALLVFLTNLDDPVLAESFVRNMDLIRRQHLVLVNMMQPPGLRPLFSDPSVATTDDLYRHLGGHILWHNLRELDSVLRSRGVQFALLDNERMSAQLVSQYLDVKRRQIL